MSFRALFLFLICELGGALPALMAVSEGPSRTPNIVLIIADDQAYTDFGFMGNELVQTPNLDRLAEQSARYPNGYVPTSLCSPSLATLLTGLYPHQSGLHYNHPPPGNRDFNRMTSASEYARKRGESYYLIRSLSTLPRLLGERGYRSFQSGKFWEGHFSNAGFTDGMTLGTPSAEPAFGNRTLESGEVVAHGNGDAGLNIGRTTMKPLFDFIKENRNRPFMIWYAPFLPHAPHDAPENILKRYDRPGRVPQHLLPYYAACTFFDETVGELIRYLETEKLVGNTLFIFVSDNGWAPTPEPHRQPGQFVEDIRAKRSPFDRGLRTPILIRWDQVVKPDTHTSLCSSVDILPTVLDAVGLGGKAAGLPGRSLLPSALGRGPLAQRPVFGEIYPGDASVLGHPSRDIAYRWVRSERLKLIVPHPHHEEIWGGYLSKPALFDVVADPMETRDLSNDPSYEEPLRELQRLLDLWWTPGNDITVPKFPGNGPLSN